MSVSMAGAEVWGITSASPPRQCRALCPCSGPMLAGQCGGKGSAALQSTPTPESTLHILRNRGTLLIKLTIFLLIMLKAKTGQLFRLLRCFMRS